MENRYRLAFCLIAFICVLCLTAPLIAGPLEDGSAAYERGDFAAVFRLWKPLAEQGDAQAQTNLGIMYYSGQGVPQNYAEALKWFRKAAEQGFAQAPYMLGAM